MLNLLITLLIIIAIVILISAIKNAYKVRREINQIKNKHTTYLIKINIIAASLLVALIFSYTFFLYYDHKYYTYLIASFIFTLSSGFIYVASIVTHDMGKLLVKLDKARKLDSLTEIYNRKQIMNEIQKEFIRFQRYQRPSTVAIIDINNFKKINDTIGHQAGDKVILDLVKNIITACRKTDKYGRFGGDEFIIVLPETKLDQAHLLMDRIINNIKNIKITIDQHTIEYSISIGLAEVSANFNNYDQWLHCADLELLKIKH